MGKGRSSTQAQTPLTQVQLEPLVVQVSPDAVHDEPAEKDAGQSVSPQPAKLPAPTASADASSIRVIMRMQPRKAGAVPSRNLAQLPSLRAPRSRQRCQVPVPVGSPASGPGSSGPQVRTPITQ